MSIVEVVIGSGVYMDGILLTDVINVLHKTFGLWDVEDKRHQEFRTEQSWKCVFVVQ